MNIILSKIKSARRRMILGRAVWSLQVCLLLGGCVCLLLQLISLVVPFFYVNYVCIGVVGAALVAAVVLTAAKLPDMREAAKAVDGSGLNSRILTAYELKDETDYMSEMQRKDAERYAAAFSPKSIKIKIRVLPAVLLAAVVVFTGICVPIKTIAKDRAEMNHELQELKESTILEVRAAAQKVLDTYPDNTELKTAVDQLVKDTVISINKAETEQAVNRHFERFKVKLQELVEEYTLTEEEKQLQEDIKEALKQAKEEAEEAGEGLPEEYQPQVDEALAKAEEAIKNADSEDKLKDALEDLEYQLNEIKDKAASGSGQGGTGSQQGGSESQQGSGENQNGQQDSGENQQGSQGNNGSNGSAGDQGSNGSNGSAGDQGNNGSNGSASDQGNSGSSSSSGSQGNSGSSGSQGSSGQENGENSGSQGGGSGQGNSGNSGSSGSGDGSGQGNGSGSGQGNGSGSGQGSGSGSGQGSGSGSGQGGEGWNYGSSNLYEHDGKTGESVTYDTDVVDKYLKGQAGDSGSSATIKGEGGTTEGDKANYSEVHAAYENQANSDMSNMDLNEEMQELIKDYFSETK